MAIRDGRHSRDSSFLLVVVRSSRAVSRDRGCLWKTGFRVAELYPPPSTSCVPSSRVSPSGVLLEHVIDLVVFTVTALIRANESFVTTSSLPLHSCLHSTNGRTLTDKRIHPDQSFRRRTIDVAKRFCRVFVLVISPPTLVYREDTFTPFEQKEEERERERVDIPSH